MALTSLARVPACCLLLPAHCPPALPCAQGEEAKAEDNVSGVTDTALVELREGLFAVLASGQAAEAEAAEAAGEKPDALAIAVTASAVEAVATGPQEQLSRASVEAGAGLVNKLAEA